MKRIVVDANPGGTGTLHLIGRLVHPIYDRRVKMDPHRSEASRVRRVPEAGFTLVELLFVIVIVAVLAALLLPVLNKVTENSRTAVCTSNFHQMGAAAVLWGGEHNNDLPIGRIDVSFGQVYCWYDGLALYMGRPNYLDPVTGRRIPLPGVFACPSNMAKHRSQTPPTTDPAYPSWPYTGDYGYNTLLNPYSASVPVSGYVTKFSQLSHPSTVLLICEVSYQNQWDRITLFPRPAGMAMLGARHSGADNMLWADAHVSRMTWDELHALATDPKTPWKGNQFDFYEGMDAP